MDDKKLHDSGKRQDFESGCVRDTAENKSRPDLISPYFNMRVGDHLEKGASKYAERNWEQGMPISRCIASLERHLNQYKMGLMDEDHLAAIGCNIVFVIHYEEMIKRGLLPTELNDMPFYELEPEDEEIANVINHVDLDDDSNFMCGCKTCRSKRVNDAVQKNRESDNREAGDSETGRDGDNSGTPKFT